MRVVLKTCSSELARGYVYSPQSIVLKNPQSCSFAFHRLSEYFVNCSIVNCYCFNTCAKLEQRQKCQVMYSGCKKVS